MTYMLICFVEECSERSYAGSMQIVAAYARSDDPTRCGYQTGLRERTTVDVRGDAFHVLAADVEDGTLSAESLAVTTEEGARLVTSPIRKAHLKKTFAELIARSAVGCLHILLEWNGSSSKREGSPVTHYAISFRELCDRIDTGAIHEDTLYTVQQSDSGDFRISGEGG